MIMKVGVISDIHDNIWNLDKVISYLQGKMETVISLGDYCAPFVLPYIASLEVPVYACLGNNDEDQIAQVQMAGDLFTWTPLAKEYGQVEIGGKKMAFCHYPKLAELLAKSGEYDAVFHGHNHMAKEEKFGETLLANPGAVCGIQKGKPGQASFGIYDSEANQIEIIDLESLLS